MKSTDNASVAANPTMRTRDLDEAADYVGRVYVPHRLQCRGGEPFTFELSSSSSPRLTFGRLSYGAPVELVVPPMTTDYHMNLPIRGAVVAKQGKNVEMTQAQNRGVMFDPTQPHVAEWAAGTILYAVKIPVRAIESHASALLGRRVDRPIQFDLGFDLAGAPGRGLVSAVRYLRRELSRPGGIGDSPILRGQLESYVLTQLLLAVPNTLTQALGEPDNSKPHSRHVAQVLDRVHDDPAHPWTIGELARVAGVSARALNNGFKDDIGQSPMAYVRGVRLDRAHADLEEAESGDSVTDIASRSGFLHPSRFAEHYRRRFGLLPSQTLNRAVQTNGQTTEAQLSRIARDEASVRVARVD